MKNRSRGGCDVPILAQKPVQIENAAPISAPLKDEVQASPRQTEKYVCKVRAHFIWGASHLITNFIFVSFLMRRTKREDKPRFFLSF